MSEKAPGVWMMAAGIAAIALLMRVYPQSVHTWVAPVGAVLVTGLLVFAAAALLRDDRKQGAR